MVGIQSSCPEIRKYETDVSDQKKKMKKGKTWSRASVIFPVPFSNVLQPARDLQHWSNVTTGQRSNQEGRSMMSVHGAFTSVIAWRKEGSEHSSHLLTGSLIKNWTFLEKILHFDWFKSDPFSVRAVKTHHLQYLSSNLSEQQIDKNRFESLIYFKWNCAFSK